MGLDRLELSMECEVVDEEDSVVHIHIVHSSLQSLVPSGSIVVTVGSGVTFDTPWVSDSVEFLHGSACIRYFNCIEHGVGMIKCEARGICLNPRYRGSRL